MHIDHLVWYCGSLEAGRSLIAAKTDAEPSAGGSHPGEGTANCLLSLGPRTYLEILGRDPDQPASALDPAIARLRGTRLYHWAMGGSDLTSLRDRAKTSGLTGGDLVSGGRITPDGIALKWTCFGLRDHSFGALVPFFIDWHETPHPAATTPNGARLGHFEVFTPETAALQGIYDTLGIDIPITHRSEPGLVATLESRKGHFKLESFSPLPAGYVI